MPGEKVNTQLMLQRLSELGVCILSGVRENLTVIPVDFDLSNYLVSNVAQVAKTIASSYQRTFNYEFLFQQYKVEFETSGDFVRYNKDLLDILSVDLTAPQALEADPESALYNVWEWLTNKHVKGLQKVKSGTDVLNRYSYQNWIFRELARKQESKLVIIK